jgi:hypothetical protein
VSKITGGITNGIKKFFGVGGSKDPVRSIERLAVAADRAAYSIRNVPIGFNAAGARARIGAGLATGGGGLTVNGGIRVNVDSSTTWEGFKRQINVAADSGDVFARSLTLSAR